MNDSFRKGLSRMRLAALAAALASAGAVAADDTVFNLVHYQISFGQGVPEPTLYLASIARNDEAREAHGYSGNPRNRSLFNSDSRNDRKGAASAALDLARALLAIAIGGALIYLGPVQDYKACRKESSAGACNSDFIAAAPAPKQ